MKLDLDTVRSILLAVENTPANSGSVEISIDGVDEDTLFEHIELLEENGLVVAQVLGGGFGEKRIVDVAVQRLTWAGHDFLANAKNATVWEKTKAFVIAKGGNASFEVVKVLLTQVAAQHFGLGTS